MSLLAIFYKQIKASQEDIATEILKYILQHSNQARNHLKNKLFANTYINVPELTYTTQLIKDNLGRTDLSGLDAQGNEIVIFECKFWASLTENQPIAYLQRLKENGILVFLCPNLRKKSLQLEVERKLNMAQINHSLNHDVNSIIIDNTKHILFMSWREILDELKSILELSKESRLVSDIDQIIGFCEVVDKNSFKPLSEQDLSPEIGRNISSYYMLIDDVLNTLAHHEKFKRDNLTEGKPSYGIGFVKYRRFDVWGISFGVNYTCWQEFADTPFWLRVTDSSFKQNLELKNKLLKISNSVVNQMFETSTGDIYYPIYPTLYANQNQVANDMCEQIISVYQALQSVST